MAGWCQHFGFDSLNFSYLIIKPLCLMTIAEGTKPWTYLDSLGHGLT